MTISRKVGLHVLNSTGLALGRPAACKLVDPSLDTYRRVRAEVGENGRDGGQRRGRDAGACGCIPERVGTIA